MNRRIVLALGPLSAAFATAGPQMGLAQSDLLVGSWKLNLEKSKFSPGPAPKSQTLNFQRVGQDLQIIARKLPRCPADAYSRTTMPTGIPTALPMTNGSNREGTDQLISEGSLRKKALKLEIRLGHLR